MKITDVVVYEVKPRWIFVKVCTDEGIEGWGEMISGTKTETVVAGAKEMGAYLMGRNPFEIERLWQEMYKSFFRGGPINGTIVSGFEMALWDIKGKYFNVPVYQLLGGKVRDKLRTYASQLQFGWGQTGISEHLWAVTPDDYAYNVKLAIEEGYDAVKIDFFDRDEDGKPLTFLDTTGFLTPSQLKMVEDRMKAAREVAGDKVDIIMENHSYPDALGALQLAKLAEKYNKR